MAVGDTIGGQTLNDPNAVQPASPFGPVGTGLLNASANIPNAFQTGGWNAMRGSNTIMEGGFGGKNGIIRNNTNPRAWRRFANVDVYKVPSPTTKMSNVFFGGEGWSPYFISNFVNHAATKIAHNGSIAAARQSAGLATSFKGKVFAGSAQFLEKHGVISGSGAQHVLTPGMWSQMHTASNLGRMAHSGGTLSQGTASSLNNFMTTRGHSGMGGPMFKPGMAADDAHKAFMAHSSSSKIGQRIMGRGAGAIYGDSAMAGRPIFDKAVARSAESLAYGGVGSMRTTSTREMAKGFGRTMSREAAEKALLAEGKTVTGRAVAGTVAKKSGAYAATWLAGSALDGPLPIMDVAMTAWLIYDLAKLGAGMARDFVVKPAVQFAKEGVSSVMGDVRRGPLEGSFKDNSAAMTSRSRGVAAIQNSRLNARSFLGAEAGAMAAHFG